MSNLSNLLKIQILSNLKINKIRARNGRGRIGGFTGLIFYLILFVFLFAFVGATYTQTFSDSLILFGKEQETVSLIIALSALVSFLFSFYAMSSVLYNFNDYDMLLSMPIRKYQIVLSKLLYSYFLDLAISLLVVIGCLYKYYGIESFGVTFALRAVLLSAVSPFFALAVSIVVGTLFSLISSLFKRKNVVQIIMYVAFIVAWILLTTLSSDNSVDPTESIGKLFFIYPVLNNALNGDAINILYYCLICFASFAIITAVVCVAYSKLHTVMTANKTSRNFKLKTYNRSAQFKTLIKKEFRRLFSSPLYTLNCIFGLILIAVFAVTGIIIVNAIEDVEGVDFSALSEIVRYVPIFLCFFFIMSPTTACSIATEGKNLWIYKTSPIKSSVFFGAKLFINYVFSIPAALFVSVSVAICLRLEFIVAILFVLLSVLIAVFSGIAGLFLNILFPHLEWESENQAVKQGVALLFTVLLAFVFAGLSFVTAYYLEISTLLLFVIYLAFFAIVDIVLYYVVFKHGDDILDKRR